MLDVECGRLEYPTLKRRVAKLATRDDPGAVLIENKRSGTSLIQNLHREDPVRPIGILPEGDKITRMSAQSAKIETA